MSEGFGKICGKLSQKVGLWAKRIWASTAKESKPNRPNVIEFCDIMSPK